MFQDRTKVAPKRKLKGKRRKGAPRKPQEDKEKKKKVNKIYILDIVLVLSSFFC